MAPLPEDAAEQVAKMRNLEQDILAAVDRMVGSDRGGGGGGGGANNHKSSTMSVAERAKDPATVARTGMSRLRRELQELEAIAEEQDRPSDRTLVLEALAERTESHDNIRQMLRDATLEAGGCLSLSLSGGARRVPRPHHTSPSRV